MAHIYSMTGFAAGSLQYETNELSCEIRSLNSRYLEVFVKLPLLFRDLEDQIKELIRSKISRGKINCAITISSQTPVLPDLKVDKGAVLLYKELLEQIRDIVGIKQPIQLSDILQFKDILSFEEDTEIDKGLQESVFRLVNETLEQLNETRGIEGHNLVQDLESRIHRILTLTEEIRNLSKENAREEFEKLHQRLLAMIDEGKVDSNRLEMELAIISDRVDISEEVVRMQSHISLFQETLQKGSPVGKKLNFILQEMHREANTMASKSTMVSVSHRIIEIKEEVERIREQVQNIE